MKKGVFFWAFSYGKLFKGAPRFIANVFITIFLTVKPFHNKTILQRTLFKAISMRKITNSFFKSDFT